MSRGGITFNCLWLALMLEMCTQAHAAVSTEIQAIARQGSVHTDLGWFPDTNGMHRPIKSLADWERRREDILKNLEAVMGPLPNPQPPIPLDIRIENRVELDNGMLRLKIAYQTDSTFRRVRAFLFVPKAPDGNTRRPAVLCLHQTIPIGKDEPAGLGGSTNLHYALELARRGYVTLAPDYPSFGEYLYDFPEKNGYVSGTMKAIYDNTRALDVLESLKEVDSSHIGCIGHSLGGHNGMFTAAFDRRIKVVVSNCGFTGNQFYKWWPQGWSSPRYMPRIAARYGTDPTRLPYDFPEIIACLVPRPFLASSPIHDDNFGVEGVRSSLAAAGPIYALHNAASNLRANYPECAHDFPESSRKVAYAFLDEYLKTPSSQQQKSR